MYVTLEPCNIFRRTPPCVKTIEQIPFKRIVIGMKDPNPKVNGKSIAYLKKKGYKIDVGICMEDVKSLNTYFEYYIKNKKTYFIMKAAQTIDGCITDKEGARSAITCRKSLNAVHLERYKADAILVGSNTINVDNPILDTRYAGKKYKPSLIILDFSNKLNYSKRVVEDTARMKYIFVSDKKKGVLKKRKDVEYIFIKKKKDAWLILKNEFYKKNIISVFIEGGGRVFSDALLNNAVDEFMLFISPKMFGSGCLRGIDAPLASKRNFELIGQETYGEDVMLRYRCLQE